MGDLDGLEVEAITKRPNLTEIIADTLRDAIYNGVLKPGQELNQAELATRFGVSRVPVREALRLLEAEGLVMVEPFRRVIVSKLSHDHLDQLMRARATLEALVLKQAAAHLTPEHFAEMKETLDEAEAPDIEHARWLELNHKFHADLLAPSGWDMLISLINSISRNVGRYMTTTGVRVPTVRTGRANQEHRKILGYCESGEIDKAVDALVAHVDGTRTTLLDALDQKR